MMADTRWGRKTLDKFLSPGEIHQYYDGIKVGVEWFAVYKDGKQLVGVMQRPISEVYTMIDAERNELVLEWIEKNVQNSVKEQ